VQEYDLSNSVYLVALGLGVIILLSVCFVYVKHQVLKFSGIGLSVIGLVLVGMSIWTSVEFSISESGVTAKLMQEVQEAKQEAQHARAESRQNAEAAIALRDTLENIKVQDVLRTNGVYSGPLDGTMSAATVRSIKRFQASKQLPQTGKIDADTIKALKVQPVPRFPELQLQNAPIRVSPAN
jgi:hypothetical protein